MVKIRNATSVGLGLLLLGFSMFVFLDNSQIELFSIFLPCYSVFLILDGILENKSTILYIMLGCLMLISAIILILSQKLLLSSFGTVLFIIFAIIFLLLGLGGYFGFLPKKFFNRNL